MPAPYFDFKLIRRLLLVAAVYVALLVCVQGACAMLTDTYVRQSVHSDPNGGLPTPYIAIMILSPLANYIRIAFLAWVVFYYGKINSLPFLALTIGSIWFTFKREASPDRTSLAFFEHDWTTRRWEFAYRAIFILAVTVIIWFVAAELGVRYRILRYHTKKLPVFLTYVYAALAFLTVDLLFQFYFYVSTVDKGAFAPTDFDWKYPFLKAVFGLLVACGIGAVLTKIRRAFRERDKAARLKEENAAG